MKTREQVLADAIYNADTWEECENECKELCDLAGMSEYWDSANGENFEQIVDVAMTRLGV